MTITFSQTARDVVTLAYEDRAIARRDKVTAHELQYGLDKLNLILKHLAAAGDLPWTDAETTATIPAGTSTVTLNPRPTGVFEARLQVTATYQRPLTRWSNGEYDEIPNKAQPGEPLAYEILETPTAMQMRVWPVPSTAATVVYSYQRVIEDVAANTPLNVPQRWLMAIGKVLQAELTRFGPVPDKIENAAAQAMRQMLDYDRPESYMIEADR